MPMTTRTNRPSPQMQAIAHSRATPLSSPNQAFFLFSSSTFPPQERVVLRLFEPDRLPVPGPPVHCKMHEVYSGAGPRASVVFAVPAPQVAPGGEVGVHQGAHDPSPGVQDLE